MKCVKCGTTMESQNSQVFSKTYVCPNQKCNNRCPVDTGAKDAATTVGLVGGVLAIIAAIVGADDESS